MQKEMETSSLSGWKERLCECQTLLQMASRSLGMLRSILRLEPSLSFSTVNRDAWSAPQHNANKFISGSKALEVPKRSPGWDIVQPNVKPVSGKFHTINFIGDWWSDEGQTFSCFTVCLSSPFVTVINCKVPPWILLRTVWVWCFWRVYCCTGLEQLALPFGLCRQWLTADLCTPHLRGK